MCSKPHGSPNAPSVAPNTHTILPMKSPAWTEDELVLAGALVVKNDWRELRTGERDVQELSELLRSLPLHGPDALGIAGFRSPDSVSRKTSDFATNHPGYRGRPTRCGEPTLQMISAFIQREAEMLMAADAIQDGISSGRSCSSSRRSQTKSTTMVPQPLRGDCSPAGHFPASGIRSFAD